MSSSNDPYREQPGYDTETGVEITLPEDQSQMNTGCRRGYHGWRFEGSRDDGAGAHVNSYTCSECGAEKREPQPLPRRDPKQAGRMY